MNGGSRGWVLLAAAGFGIGCVPCLVPCGGYLVVEGAVAGPAEPRCELQLHSCGRGQDLLLTRRPVRAEFRETFGVARTRHQLAVWLVCGGNVVAAHAVRYRENVLREHALHFGRLEVGDSGSEEERSAGGAGPYAEPRCSGRHWIGVGGLDDPVADDLPTPR